MQNDMNGGGKINKFKPAVTKKILFFIAGVLWSVGGVILLVRGVSILETYDHLLLEISIGIVTGFLFYIIIFKKITGKHINRIINLENDKPCMFAFFDVKSYLLMAVMISGGIIVKKMQFVKEEYYFTFLIAMGIPLVLSALRFFISGIIYKSQQ